MQKSKFTAEQMTAIIAKSSAYKDAINDVARKHGISTKTIGNWKIKFGNMREEWTA